MLTLGVEEGAVVRYVLFDRGSIADEYASLPEYHGPLPPGDVVALSANPTVAHAADRSGRRAACARSRGRRAPPPTCRPRKSCTRELADVLGVPVP